MDLEQLIQQLDIRQVAGPSGVRILDITDDSRTVLPDSLFVARVGPHFDGRVYIGQAINEGARAVLTDEEGALRVTNTGIAVLVADDVALASARLAERFHGDPTSKLKLVGITGTNGKTTVAHLLHGILNRSGVRAGLIGTVEIDDGRETAQAELTTPGAIELSRTFSTMVDSGCQIAVMEVSSHALDQRRAAGLSFDVGVFTTLGTDHMDYHTSREAYLGAKRRLFEMLPESGAAVMNTDDEVCERMLAGCPARVVGCSLGKDENKDENKVENTVENVAQVTSRRVDGIDVTLTGAFGSIEAKLPLAGEHNAMNLLEAVVVAHELGVDVDLIASALKNPSLPRGRLERIPVPGGLDVFIDFAHTPDALERTLSELRRAMNESQRKGRLWAVFGCGGHKDRTKRPVMGEIAGRLADKIVLTSDNPRSEDPDAIIEAIFQGVDAKRRADVIREPLRERAIDCVMREAEAGDVILIAGKGHETTQELCDEAGSVIVRAFDDEECVRLFARERAKAT